MNRISPFWFYMGLVSILVIAFVYYQGLTADVNAVGPYAIQALALAQGRDPSTFNFSNYPKTGAGPGYTPGAGPATAGHTVGVAGGHPAANLYTTRVTHPAFLQANSRKGMGRLFNRGAGPDTNWIGLSM